jgi:tight adherence protein B
VAGLVVAAAAAGGASAAVVGFALAVPAATALGAWRRQRARAAARGDEQEVLAACRLLAGLLGVGHVPAAALAAAAGDAPVLAEAAVVLAVGGSAGPVLRRLGAAPGRSGLVELGIAWEVSERTGASLTATLDALAERLAAQRAVRQVVAAELAAPRATGRLLAVLPGAGVLLGYGFGGDPVTFLTGSPAGQVALVVGISLACAGVVWTERIADGGGP